MRLRNKAAKIAEHKSEAAAGIYQGHVTAGVLSEMENGAAPDFKNILEYQGKKGA
jgi:hypothetical protein